MVLFVLLPLSVRPVIVLSDFILTLLIVSFVFFLHLLLVLPYVNIGLNAVLYTLISFFHMGFPLVWTLTYLKIQFFIELSNKIALKLQCTKSIAVVCFDVRYLPSSSG